MKIPDKESIAITESFQIQLGVEKKGEEWQCGVLCGQEPLQIVIFERNSPEKKLVLTIPERFRKGKIYSFALSGDLEGLCYGVGAEGRADAFAREYCYGVTDGDTGNTAACQGDNFGRSRRDIYSVFSKEAPKNEKDGPRLASSGLLIYKLHVRGYTKLAKVKNPGTFQALSEKSDYIKELGMNAVLLMPCYEFHEIPAVRQDKLNSYRTPYVNKVNYWGYTDGYYYAPKTAYCASADVRREYLDMVRDFHKKGIEVLMEFFFPQDMAPVAAVDVLRFWHEQYGVDGFRLICSDKVLYAVKTDLALAGCKLLGMDFGEDTFHNGAAEEMQTGRERLIWYDEGFMEAGRHFLRGDEESLATFLKKTVRHQNGLCTVNFMADQNCLTLMDTVSYERRHNEHNGENNADGRRSDISFNCGAEGASGRASVRRLREKLVKNALTMVFLSASVPMIMAGDEFGISHGGNNNPYCQDNEVNYTDWRLLEKNRSIYEYAASLTALRREHGCLRPEADFSLSDHLNKGMPDLSFHGERAWYPVVEDYSHDIALLYCGAYAGETSNVYVLYNMHNEPHEFAVIATAGKKWELAAATDVSGVVFDETKKTVRLLPKTAAVYVSKTE